MIVSTNDSSPPPRDLALKYAGQDWLLFPLCPLCNGQCTCGHSGQKGCKPGKHPAIKQWQNRATTDPEQIRQWWMQRPDAGIAIATGRASNLIVIDCDNHAAFEVLKELVDGQPRTMAVQTGKGVQFYFTYSVDFDVKSDSGIAGIPGLDVRAIGGYVVAAGSLHQSGKRYKIVNPGVDPQPLPAKLSDFLREHCSKVGAHPNDTVDREDLSATDALLREGGRNNAVTRKVGGWFGQGLSEGRVREKAHSYNMECCTPPLPADEVDAIVASIAKAEASKKVKRDSVIPKRKLKTVPLAYVEVEQPRWLWNQRIPYGKLTVLEGDPGRGKSIVTMAVTAAVTTGKSLPGGPALDPSNVLILACEDGVGDTIKPRLVAAGGDDKRCFVVSGVETDQDGEEVLCLPTDIPALKEFIITHQVTLVIIDPLTAYVSGKLDSHKDADIRRMLTPLAKLAEETGAAIVAIRHLNKGTGSAQHRGMGSTAIGAAARSILLVAEDPEDDTARVLATVKNNLSKKPTSLRFRVEDGAVAGSIRWDGPVPYLADELLAPPMKGEYSRNPELDAIITKALSSGPQPKSEVMQTVRDAGIFVDDRTIRRAILRMGGTLNAGGKLGVWGLAGQVDNDQPPVQNEPPRDCRRLQTL